jgi:proton glutamate symport protein
MGKTIQNYLTSPVAIICGAAAGIVIGLEFKGWVPLLKPVGEVYLSILQMCVLPIVITAVTVSFGNLLEAAESKRLLRKILGCFGFALAIVLSVSLSLGVLLTPLFMPDQAEKVNIGKLMVADGKPDNLSRIAAIQEIDTRWKPEKAENKGLITFILSIIPQNIFAALTNGDTLKVVFFFSICAVMLKFVAEVSYQTIIALARGIFDIFQKITKKAMLFLPFGLCSLMAAEFADEGLFIVTSFLNIVVLCAIIIFLLLTFSSMVIWKHTGGPYKRQFQALKDPIIICLGAKNSMAAVPATISGLGKSLKLDPDMVNLTVPMGITLCRFGTMMSFAVLSVYAMHLYGTAINMQNLIVTMIASVLASFSTIGASGLVSRQMLTLVLTPLNIPAGALVMVLIALDPILDPLITLVNVYVNCAVTAVIADAHMAGLDPIHREHPFQCKEAEVK